MSQSLYDEAQPCRALWVHVVTQAKDDLESEPINSIPYDDAVAFFAGSGQWATTRAFIADLLGMHPDDLFRSGQQWIAARRKRDGLPQQEPRLPPALDPPSTAQPLLPRPVARPGYMPKPPAARRGDWIAAGVSLAHTPKVGNVRLTPEKQPPVGGLRKGGQRHWSTKPGATNPFAPRRKGWLTYDNVS